MGHYKNEKLGKQDERRRRREKKHGTVDWENVDARTIKHFVLLAQRLDGAVRFGRSRDGAVYSIGFYVGEERFTEWIRGDDGADDEFARIADEIAEDYEITGSVHD